MKRKTSEQANLTSSPVTKIDLSVNGHLVPFTFVGHPTAEYMEQARLQAEATERENTEKLSPKSSKAQAEKAALIKRDKIAERNTSNDPGYSVYPIRLIETMSMQEMVDEYNKLSGSSITRFSSREVGARRLQAERVKAEKAEQQRLKVSMDSIRSAGIRKSWEDKKVAQARTIHHHVECNGKIYRSVAQAFEELGLPMGKHIRFRGELKKAGADTFVHQNRVYEFRLVPKAS